MSSVFQFVCAALDDALVDLGYVVRSDEDIAKLARAVEAVVAGPLRIANGELWCVLRQTGPVTIRPETRRELADNFDFASIRIKDEPAQALYNCTYSAHIREPDRHLPPPGPDDPF